MREEDRVRWRAIRTVVTGAICVVLIQMSSTNVASASEAPTWDDVAPILEAHCLRCHMPMSVAPMSLRTFDEARPWAKAIRRNVTGGTMPPWFADPKVGRFKNDPRLSPREIETITRWVDGGAPPGDRPSMTQAQPPSMDGTSWQLGTPDLVVEMPEAFEIPADGTIDYVYLRTPIGNSEPRWVRAVEVLAGSRAHVHHIDVMVCKRGCPSSPFYAALEAGVPTQPPRAPQRRQKPEFDPFGMVDGDDTEFYYSFLPGGMPRELPEGHGRLLPAGAELVLSLHYTANGEPAQDRSRVGLYFLDEPPQRRVVSFFLDNWSIWVPAGAPRYEARTRRAVARDVELLAITPHMHFRGVAAELAFRPPASAARPILSVPAYDFAWQITYELEEPLRLAKGSELQLLNVFDNSADNPYNPDPTVDVAWGLQSWDEMSSAFLEFAVPLDADPDTVFAAPPETP